MKGQKLSAPGAAQQPFANQRSYTGMSSPGGDLSRLGFEQLGKLRKGFARAKAARPTEREVKEPTGERNLFRVSGTKVAKRPSERARASHQTGEGELNSDLASRIAKHELRFTHCHKSCVCSERAHLRWAFIFDDPFILEHLGQSVSKTGFAIISEIRVKLRAWDVSFGARSLGQRPLSAWPLFPFTSAVSQANRVNGTKLNQIGPN
jgi:hypothetical protein